MNNLLTYKGYTTKIEFDADERVLFGKIEGISDLINFESDNAAEIEKEFHNAVDDYLVFCDECGQIPEKPFKGSFNVRVNPEVHRLAFMQAVKKGVSLNTLVCTALDEYLSSKKTSLVINYYEQSKESYDVIARFNSSEFNWTNNLLNKTILQRGGLSKCRI